MATAVQMIPVQSSQLAAVGYKADANTLHVAFRRSDNVYVYSGVSRDEYKEMITADSIGGYFNKHVKSRPFIKTDAPAQAEEKPHVAEPVTLTITEAAPEIEATAAKSTDLVTSAMQITVASVQDQTWASNTVHDIKEMRKQVEATFAPMKEAAHRAHRVICEQERVLDSPLAAAELHLKQQIGTFVLAQRQAAQKQEAEEREQARLAAQQRAQVEAEERALQAAIELEAEGRSEDAEAVLSFPAPVAPRYIAPAPIAPAVAQVAGVGTRATWKHRVVNEDQIPREFLMVNEKAIAEVVKRTGGKIRIPGVEIYQDAIVTVATQRRS